MRVTCDPAKRARTLAERGLDFHDAPEVLRARQLTLPDERRDYGERRLVTIGPLRRRWVVLVWTPRPGGVHVISMRKANAREARYQATVA